MQVPDRDASSLLRSPLTTRSPRIVLVQSRSEARMVEQEQKCFSERCRVPPESFHVVNVAAGDEPTRSHIEQADAVLIGGAGTYSATEDYPWTASLLDFVRYTIDREIPLFGSCWGHQIIARALGGRVEYDPDHAELGCGWVRRTAAGDRDPLFHRFSERFRANMGHHDRVVELPSEAVELARNDIPYQAFRLKDLPVYGTQFHSELDARRERERILVYREYYRDALPDEETVQKVLADLADTTEVDNLLYDFLTTFVARSPLEPPVNPDTVSLDASSSPVGELPPSKHRIPGG